jgi:hypothetical protein
MIGWCPRLNATAWFRRALKFLLGLINIQSCFAAHATDWPYQVKKGSKTT